MSNTPKRWAAGRVAAAAAKAFAAIASASLLASAFPPVEAAEGAWVGVVPLILLARFTRGRAAFLWGFLSGCLFWGMSLVWLLSLHRTGGPVLLVSLGWVLLSAYCACYSGLFVLLASRAFTMLPAGSRLVAEEGARQIARGMLHNVSLMLLFCVFWVGLEYGRCSLFSGFPWNALGVSQYRNLAVIQVAEWSGVHGVSAILVLINAALALTGLRLFAVYTGRTRARVHVELMLGLAVCAAVWVGGVARVRALVAEEQANTEVRIAAVQPNVPQVEKWTDEFVSDIMLRLRTQTECVAAVNPDLVVWPETAVPSDVDRDALAIVLVDDMARLCGSLLLGAIEVELAGAIGQGRGGGTRVRYFNSSFLYDGEGRRVDVYRKRHLVPFGEYVPLSRYLPVLDRLAPLGFSCAAGREATVFRLAHPDVMFSVLICFEDAFGYLAREGVLRGARLLINQTNDAWFDGSSAARQHMSHCVFRCVENRVPAVRATNSGITCFISRSGMIDETTENILASGEEGETQYRTAGVRVPGSDMALTVYTRYGDRLFALPCFVAVLAAFVLVVARPYRENTN